MSDLVKRLRIKAGMIEMGELIAWGSDVALMREAADALEATARGAREDYKLVPVEPTAEMMAQGAIEMGARDEDARTVWRAMIAVAPCPEGIREGAPYDDPAFESLCREHEIWGTPAAALCAVFWEAGKRADEQQPELAKYQPCGCVVCTCEHETQCQGCGGHHCGTHPVGQFSNPVYQQPAEQQPSADDSLTPVPDELFAAEFNAWWEQHGQFCRAGGGDYKRTFAFEAWRHLYPRLMSLQKLVAEQQPAPDVGALVEALDQIERWDGFPSTDEVWEDSGEPVSYGAAFGSNGERDFMREVARKALAAYRKGGEV